MEIEQIIPLNGHVYIEPVERKQVLVSDSAHLETFGKVVAVADDLTVVSDATSIGICSVKQPDIKVGDYVAFEMWDVKDISTADKKYFLIKADEIICKVTVREEGLAA